MKDAPALSAELRRSLISAPWSLHWFLESRSKPWLEVMPKSRDIGEVLSDEELLDSIIEVPANSRVCEPLLENGLVSLAEAV